MSGQNPAPQPSTHQLTAKAKLSAVSAYATGTGRVLKCGALRPVLAGISLMFLLLACGKPAETQAQQREPVPAGITGLNHSTTYIDSFTVDGAWGGNISSVLKGGGGGSTTCCVMLPYHYRQGLTAKIRWNQSNTAEDHWKETVATIDPYPDGAGQVWVHFFPGDTVRIVVSKFDPGHPKYPGPNPEETLLDLKKKGLAP